jgi:CubicO group peptidase (beta-lactamase class C family)
MARAKSSWSVLLVGVLGIAGIAVGAEDSRASKVRQVLTDAFQAQEFNGVALVAVDDVVLVREALGFADSTRDKPLIPKHRFNIGSVAKEFSAVAVMRLVESGQVSLDDSLRKTLGDFPPWADAVRIGMLLDYTSGLPEMDWRNTRSDADVRAGLLRATQPVFQPGSAYGYTYTNVMARQFVVESVAKRPFAQVVHATLRKCRLRNAIVDPAPDERLIARSFNKDFVADPSNLPISGIVFVTADDLLHWSQCLREGRAVRSESLATLARAFGDYQGALGYARWDGKLLSHAHHGESRNYEALLRHDAARRSTIVLLGNSKRQKVHAIAAAIEAALDANPVTR